MDNQPGVGCAHCGQVPFVHSTKPCKRCGKEICIDCRAFSVGIAACLKGEKMDKSKQAALAAARKPGAEAEPCNPHIYIGEHGACVNCYQHPIQMLKDRDAQIKEIKRILVAAKDNGHAAIGIRTYLRRVEQDEETHLRVVKRDREMMDRTKNQQRTGSK